MIKRIYHHYEQWEDYQSGMYNRPCLDALDTGISSEERIEKAVECLCNESICREYMRKVVKEWPIATEQVLSNTGMNRKSWLGWCACFLYGGCHDEETRRAWWLMSDEARAMANGIAKQVIREWEKEHENATGDKRL